MRAGKLAGMHSEIITPSPWMIAPFGLLLAAMALAPVLAPAWWRRHYATVSLGLGAVTGVYYLFFLHAWGTMGGALHEYAGFVTLVGGLFVVAGGIQVGIKGRGEPLANTVFLLAGAVLANVLGTTGAAMLLIRPWMRLNQGRIRAYHLVFFIFIVANLGGGLTPIGDPPLFLGYLQGVPFWWVAAHCWRMWAVGMGLLLAAFYGLDAFHFSRLAGPPAAAATRWCFEGRWNLFFLAVMLGAVFVDRPAFLREGLMTAAAIGSYCTTKPSVHEANGFNFHPIREVAVLFAGIFATMMPALEWLERQPAKAPGHPSSPGVFYWGTGLLSSVLDNAPTYLAMFRGLAGPATAPGPAVWQQYPAAVAAISAGAVFFGGATYIGNGPNFMVKAMAEQEKIPMPSFAGYVFRFTVPWLLPVLVMVWLLFFRG